MKKSCVIGLYWTFVSGAIPPKAVEPTFRPTVTHTRPFVKQFKGQQVFVKLPL